MSDLLEQVAGLVRLNGQEMVGKTRLQKTVYLLEAKGLGFGIEFDYHKHGPYSAEVAFAAEDAEAIGLLRTEDRLGFYQIPYTVFHVTEQTPAFSRDALTPAREQALGAMGRFSALVLELSATAVYLREHGYRENYWDEAKRRKPLKASPERLEQAKRLLIQLDLEPTLDRAAIS